MLHLDSPAMAEQALSAVRNAGVTQAYHAFALCCILMFVLGWPRSAHAAPIHVFSSVVLHWHYGQ